jgi:hypothetical protein
MKFAAVEEDALKQTPFSHSQQTTLKLNVSESQNFFPLGNGIETVLKRNFQLKKVLTRFPTLNGFL